MSPLLEAAAENARGIALRQQGKLREAIAVFERALTDYPNVLELALNLAQTRYEIGDNDGAIAAFELTLTVDRDNVAAHLGLYELLQIKADPSGAIEHQRRALARQRLFSSYATSSQRSVLVLCAPGDWQANIPVDFLFDRTTTTVHKLYILDRESSGRDPLPPCDAIWNIIAESPTAHSYLALADQIMQRSGTPPLNAAGRVLATGRMQLGQTLAKVPCIVAPIVELSLAQLLRGEHAFTYPIIVRPVGSHAGHGLERIDDAGLVEPYTERVIAESYFVSPFIDYRSADGYFRKYRIVFVDGEPYPVHLAISPRWMIHYYNAEMAANQWMRDEEARFLEDLHHAFAGPRYEALASLANAVGLEYFGIDCAIDPAGRVLVFEADPAMLVHSSDPIELYPYKHRFVPRIYRAVERMIDRRKSADTKST